MKKREVFLIFIIALIITLFGIICGLLVSKDKNISSSNSNYEENITNEIKINTDEELLNVTYEIDNNSENENNSIGILEIPKINMKGYISEGSSSAVLKNYIGHIEDTDWINGNIGLAAHNRGNKFSYCARINELEKGDEIKLNTNEIEKNYSVILKEVIEETNWDYLKSTKDNRVTLITCIKDKPNLRLCVQAIEK